MQLEATIAAATPAPPPEAPAAEAFRRLQGEVRATACESIRQDPTVEQVTVNLRASIRQNQDAAYTTLYDEGAGTSVQRAPVPDRRPDKTPKGQAPSRLQYASTQLLRTDPQHQENEVIDLTNESSPVSRGISSVPFSPKFHPADLPKYAGATNPVQYTWVYEAVVTAVGGGEVIMAKSLLLALTGIAQA